MAVTWLNRSSADLTPAAACQLVEWLGPFATWCLQADTLNKAAASYRHRGVAVLAEALEKPCGLPQEPGTCGVLFVRKRNDYPGLRDAFAWPLRWVAEAEHERVLPVKLLAEAERVRETLIQQLGDLLPTERWGLRPGLGGPADWPDLRHMDVSCDSAWVPLAGGLLAASLEGQVDRTVWATGAWQGGIAAVGFLPDKLREAVRLAVQRVFVPTQNLDEAHQLVESHNLDLSIGELRHDKPQAAEALGQFLEEFSVLPPRIPDDAENFERRCRAYLRHPRAERARDYYLSDLLPDLADQKIRGPLATVWPDWHPDLLVAVVSGGWELIPLLSEALRPQRCLLVYTEGEKEMLKATDRVEAELKLQDIPVDRISFDDADTLVAELPEALPVTLESSDPEGVLLDLTLGTKLMTLAVDHAVQPGHRLIYIQSRPGAGRRSDPASLCPWTTQVRPDGTRPPLTLARPS